MKKILIVCAVVMASFTAHAQQKSKVDYLNITIYQQGLRLRTMVITRTDSAQEKRKLNVKLGEELFNPEDYLSKQDSALLQLIEPYYNRGWKLLSFAMDGSSFDNNGVAFKYCLFKSE